MAKRQMHQVPSPLRPDSYLNSGMMGTEFYLVQEQSFTGHAPPVLNMFATAKAKVMEQEQTPGFL